jgi:2'-hydroxyisoflavone reductase
MTTRRELLQWAVCMMALPGAARATTMTDRAPKPLDILFLGGTGFLGPHQVEYALARGHRVTLFNRGHSAPGLYGDRVEILIGNRDAKIAPGLEALAGTRRWDVVIDNSGFVPRHVRDAIAMLKGRFGRYVYVSTVAVYDPSAGPVFTERSPLRAAPVPETEDVAAETYGPLKAECDRIVQAELGDASTIVRPVYVVGPGDDTDRFTYWVERVAQGGEVLGPPDPGVELQWVDVRDLCPWIVGLGERDVSGIYNASGPVQPVDWGQVLQALARLSPRPVQFRWATPAALQAAGMRLPLVRANATAQTGSVHFDGSKALAAGLAYRPLADTADATLAWWRSQSAERHANADGWPSPEQERQALALLRAP